MPTNYLYVNLRLICTKIGIDALFKMGSFTMRTVLAQESYHSELRVSKGTIDNPKQPLCKGLKLFL